MQTVLVTFSPSLLSSLDNDLIVAEFVGFGDDAMVDAIQALEGAPEGVAAQCWVVDQDCFDGVREVCLADIAPDCIMQGEAAWDCFQPAPDAWDMACMIDDDRAIKEWEELSGESWEG